MESTNYTDQEYQAFAKVQESRSGLELARTIETKAAQLAEAQVALEQAYRKEGALSAGKQKAEEFTQLALKQAVVDARQVNRSI